MDSSPFFPLNRFNRIHRARPSRLNPTEQQIRREMAAMWRIIQDYETVNDMPTIEFEDSYYGLLDEYDRGRLDAMRSPSHAVAFVIYIIEDDKRTIEGDIAEMRRLVVKMMRTED